MWQLTTEKSRHAGMNHLIHFFVYNESTKVHIVTRE